VNRTAVTINEVSASDGFAALSAFDLLGSTICAKNALIGIEEVAIERLVA